MPGAPGAPRLGQPISQSPGAASCVGLAHIFHPHISCVRSSVFELTSIIEFRSAGSDLRQLLEHNLSGVKTIRSRVMCGVGGRGDLFSEQSKVLAEVEQSGIPQ